MKGNKDMHFGLINGLESGFRTQKRGPILVTIQQEDQSGKIR